MAVGWSIVSEVIGEVLALDENLLGGGHLCTVLVAEADLGSVLVAVGAGSAVPP